MTAEGYVAVMSPPTNSLFARAFGLNSCQLAKTGESRSFVRLSSTCSRCSKLIYYQCERCRGREATMHTILRRRRFNKFQWILFVSLVTVFSVYLLKGKTVQLDINHLEDDESIILSTSQAITPSALQVNVTEDGTTPLSRSRDYQSTSFKATSIPIAPLSEFKALWETSRTDDQTNLNTTLNELDLWNSDSRCSKHNVYLLKEGSVPLPAALVSYPGSGNSWLRMLLMGITGVFVNSVYPNDAVFHSKAKSRYEVPVDCGCTLLQKTHDFSLDGRLANSPVTNRTNVLEKFKNKGLLVIRNPFTAIRSYRNFAFGGLTGTAPESSFEGRYWDDFVSRSVAGWETLASVWIRGLKEGGIVYYEKLKRDTKEELSRIAKMLGIEVDKDRLDCVIRHTKDNSFVRRKDNITRDVYSTGQRMLIHKAIESVQLVLKERGLDPLPVQYYERFNILPEYGIDGSSS